MFDKCDDKAREIMAYFESFLIEAELKFGVHFKVPRCDLARRFLDNIAEFKKDG